MVNYPSSNSSLRDIIDYYGVVTNTEMPSDIYVPDGIILHNRLKKLLLIGNDGDSKSICADFPIAHYSLLGWIYGDVEITYVTSRDIFIEADVYLLIGGSREDILSKYSCNSSFDEDKLMVPQYNIDPIFKKKLDVKMGNKNEKCHFVVLIPDKSMGIMWHLESITGFVALTEKYELYMDMQNYVNDCQSSNWIGLFNSWDFLFNQYCNYSMDQIYDSQNVSFVHLYRYQDKSDWNILSDRIVLKINEIKEQIGLDDDTIGVLLRGTDYNIAPWHKKPFDAYEAITVVESYLQHYRLNKIFLSTEDGHSYDVFLEKYGCRLLAIKRQRYYLSKTKIKYDRYDLFSKVLMAETYLIETILLSKTKIVLASTCTSARALKNKLDSNVVMYREILSKSLNSSKGTDPLVITCTGKNIFIIGNNFVKKESNLTISADIHKQIITVNGFLSQNQTYLIDEEVIYMESLTNYAISFDSGDSDLKIVMHLNNDIIKVNGSDFYQYKCMHDVSSVKVFIITKRSKLIDVKLKIQIERGLISTHYCPGHSSNTIIALRDENNIYYKASRTDEIDFRKGYFTVGGKQLLFHSDELSIYNNVITFDGEMYSTANGHIFKSFFSNEIKTIDINQCIDFEWLPDLISCNNSMPTFKLFITGLMQFNNDYINKICFDFCYNHSNVSECLYFLGIFYMNGTGCKIDLDSSYMCFSKMTSHRGITDDEISSTIIAFGKLGKYEEALRIIDSKLKNDPTANAFAGDLYFNGKIKVDYQKASYYYRMASLEDNKWNCKLFDSLWRVDTPEAISEMIPIANEMVLNGDIMGMTRLSRAYRSGKGVQKDLNESARLMRDAVLNGANWVRNELFDILWDIGTIESYKEMIEIIMPLVEKNDKNAIKRMAQAYHMGYGVIKNENMSQDLYSRLL